MSEDNVKLGLSQPWVVALGSDEGSYEPKGVFLKFQPHPRAYGNVARFLGQYVRDDKVAALGDAIRRLSALPARNLKLRDRGEIKIGDYADLVIFDAEKIRRSRHVRQAATIRHRCARRLRQRRASTQDGEHTGATPGQVVRGPGWTGWHASAPRHRSIAATAVAMQTPRMTTRQSDVLVLGGGVIGLACALSLLRAGRSVTVLDMGKVGAAASHGNCGTITPSHATPLATPGVIRQALGWMLKPDAPFRIAPRLDFGLLEWLLSSRSAATGAMRVLRRRQSPNYCICRGRRWKNSCAPKTSSANSERSVR